ncbi:MAG: ATP-dependent RNA helicase DbpA [Oceanobacter sp.]
MTNPWDTSRDNKAKSGKQPSSKPTRRNQPSAQAPTTSPAPQQSEFSQLTLPAAQVDNLKRLGYVTMTEIQRQALPDALAGRDILAQARTGSGKTASFGLALLDKLNPRFFGVQALVLCPTRELATQVGTELRRLAKYQDNIKILMLSGGVSIGPQIGSLEHGAHIVVGTPGRIKDHLRKQTLDLEQVETLVLDEADRMLDMGFSDDIHHIVGHIPNTRQTMLFSATYPTNIEKLSDELLTNPVTVRIQSGHKASSIDQYVIRCQSSQRLEALERALTHFDIQQAVLFCNTRRDTEDVCQHLRDLGFSARALHGDLEQRDRDQVLVQFKQGSSHFLIATDVAARGLDVDDLPAVINVELPRDPEVYTHRIGRTGRAGKSGLAISLVSDREDYKLETIRDQQSADLTELAFDEVSKQTPTPTPLATATLCLAAGRKHKLRPGDILGAITAGKVIPGSAVGNIDILDYVSYVAIERPLAREAVRILNQGRVKGRTIKARKV